MGTNKPTNPQGEDLGSELEGLFSKAPPPKAPVWFAAKTLARLREEQSNSRVAFGWLVRRWLWAGGAAVLVAGWLWWDRPESPAPISDAMVFAALDALVEQDEENRWWAGL